MDEKRQKLSKRHQGVDMAWYKQRDILPPAMLNFAALLGWSKGPGMRSDVLSLNDMVENVSLAGTTHVVCS